MAEVQGTLGDSEGASCWGLGLRSQGEAHGFSPGATEASRIERKQARDKFRVVAEDGSSPVHFLSLMAIS